MKRIMQISLSVIFLIGQNVQASKYFVKNETDKEQVVIFKQYLPGKTNVGEILGAIGLSIVLLGLPNVEPNFRGAYTNPGYAEIDSEVTFTIQKGETKEYDNIDWYVKNITFNGEVFGPGSFVSKRLPQGLKADMETGTPGHYTWVKDGALLGWNWTNGFKIINDPDGKPVLKLTCCPWGEY